MNNFLLGLNLTTNEVRAYLAQKQREGNLTNEAMCMVIKNVLADFMEGTVNEYAAGIAEMMVSKAQEEKKAEESDDNSVDQT